MKKILLILLCMLFLSSFVSAWGATRTINGNNITITIDETGGTGVFTIQETLSGAVITNYPSICGLSSNVLTCDSDDSSKRVINYLTSGSGSVSGIIAGGFPSTEKSITGDTSIGSVILPTIKINEFESNDGNEWIELYNPNAFEVNISGWKLYDGLTSPSLLYTIPSNTKINAKGYYVYDLTTTKLNNANEFVTLKDDADRLVDETPSLADNLGDERSWQRIPDGSDNWIFNLSTKGTANIIVGDIIAPSIDSLNVSPGITNAIITWLTNEFSNSWVYYGLTSSLGDSVNNASSVMAHSITLSNLLEDTIYYYRVKSCDSSNNCNESIINTFKTQKTPDQLTDDLMVNYVRGKILVNNAPASSSLQYKIEVLSGDNAGVSITRNVDQDIPGSMQGSGYFDSLDNLGFSTNARFRVSVLGLGYSCFNESVFENGGNGNFNDPASLIILDCRPLNYIPIITPVEDKVIDENQIIEFFINASDGDGDELTFSILGLPNGASFNSDSHEFSWTPNFSQNGTYNLEFRVSDGKETSSELVNISVRNVNRIPVINMASNYEILENIPGNVVLNASDEDQESLTYTILEKETSKVDCSIANGILYFTPSQDFIGTSSCILEVSDGIDKVNKTLTINVAHVNQAPTFIRNIPEINITEGLIAENIINLSKHFRDSDSELSYAATLTNNVIVQINQGLVTISGRMGWYGSEIVTFIASDREFNISSNPVLITIEHVGIPPSFYPLNCDLDIDEDVNYNCELEVNNSEITPLVYSIKAQNNLNCSLTGNRLYYQSSANYNGLASCEIEVSNGYGTDKKTLNVNIKPMPDAPILEPIGNQAVMENSTIQLKLNASDVDGESLIYGILTNILGYSFNPLSGIFQWTPDFGQRGIYTLIFNVSDGNLFDQKEINLTVLRNNRLPVIEDIAEVEIDEEESKKIKIIASDADNDSLLFSISQENSNKVECKIEQDGELSLKGSKDFFGNANCVVRVSDGMNYTEKTLTIKVENVPDAPILIYSPLNNPKLVNGTTQLFVVAANDPDGDLVFGVNWYLDGEEKGNEWSYLFSQTRNGNYNLTARVTDGTFNVSKEWNVFVGSLFEFTCSEVNGFMCNANQICNGNTLDTYDSNVSGNICCSQQCSAAPPKFKDADTCDSADKTNYIVIDIEEPESDDEFELGDKIEVEVELTNNFQEDDDFDITAYLYDVDEEEVLAEDSLSIDIKDDDKEKVEFEFEIKKDYDIENNLAILIVVESDENETCNQNYVSLKIERKEDDLSIEKFELNSYDAYCGQVITADIDLRNIGEDDQDVYLVLENAELGISEKTDIFELEKYDEDDKASKTLMFKIPNEAIEGTYTLKLTAFYSGEKTEETQELLLGKCNRIETGEQTLGIGNAKEDTEVLKPQQTTQKKPWSFEDGYIEFEFKDETSKWIFYIDVLLIGAIILIIIILIVWLIKR